MKIMSTRIAIRNPIKNDENVYYLQSTLQLMRFAFNLLLKTIKCDVANIKQK